MEVTAIRVGGLLRTHHLVTLIQQPPTLSQPPHGAHSHPGPSLPAAPGALVAVPGVPKVSPACPQLLWDQWRGRELGDSPGCTCWMGKRLKTGWQSWQHREGHVVGGDRAVMVAALGPGQVPRQAGGDQQLLGGHVADLHHLPFHRLRGHGATHLLREGRVSAHRHHGERRGGGQVGRATPAEAAPAPTAGFSTRRVLAAPLWLWPSSPESWSSPKRRNTCTTS